MQNITPLTRRLSSANNFSAVEAQSEEISLGEIVAEIWRRKRLILACMFAGLLLSIYYLTQATSLYRATAELIVETQQQSIVDLESVIGGTSTEESELNSQIKVIKSRRLIGNVVDSMGLANDPEFVPSLREPSLAGQAIGFVLSLLSSGGGDGAPALKQPPRETAIDTLSSRLKISIFPRTYVFGISLQAESPDKASQIVNTVANTYISDQITAKVEGTSEAALWLSEKVNALGEQLAVAEARVSDHLQSSERNVSEDDVAVSNQNLKVARGRLDALLSSLGAQGPVTERDRRAVADMQESVRVLEDIVSRQTEDLLELRQLTREAEAAAAIYTHFLQRLNEIEVQKGVQDADIRILSEAIPRYNRVWPRPLLALIFGLMAGGLIGIALAAIGKLRDTSFSTVADLEASFGIPALGTIPKAPHKNRRKLLQYALKNPASQVMEAVRNLRTSLMLNNSGDDGNVVLMTSSVPGEGKTTTAILLAINMAALRKRVLLVECDQRRAQFEEYFPDCARDRPERMGLVSAIRQVLKRGGADTDKGTVPAIRHEELTGLDLIFAEESDTNAADLFASDEFSQFVTLLRNSYDLIIIDAPPVIPVPDARLIANHADVVIYSVHAGSTPTKVVETGVRMFRDVGTPITGFNFTKVDAHLNYGAGRYGYRYGYAKRGY